jgi:predicted unusual protein kinase regulating ubiquinone biosynthesis (AarF/ABC1/UbiB family)
MYSQPFQLPGRIAFLGKALINVIGVCLQLDPEMDLMAELTPMIRDAVTGGDAGLPSLFGITADQARKALGAIVPTARNIAEASAKAASGDLVVRLSRAQESRLTRGRDRATTRLVRAVIGGVVTLSGVQWALAESGSWPAYVVVVVGGLIMLAQGRGPRVPRSPHRRR